MTKDRMNITVDEDLAERARSRGGFNVSGAVNDFLKRRLGGEDAGRAAKQVEIEQLREEAEELREKAREDLKEADRKDAEADKLEQELQEDLERQRAKIEDAIKQLTVGKMRSLDGLYVETPDEQVRKLAETVGVSADKLKREAINQYQDESDPTYQ